VVLQWSAWRCSVHTPRCTYIVAAGSHARSLPANDPCRQTTLANAVDRSAAGGGGCKPPPPTAAAAAPHHPRRGVNASAVYSVPRGVSGWVGASTVTSECGVLEPHPVQYSPPAAHSRALLSLNYTAAARPLPWRSSRSRAGERAQRATSHPREANAQPPRAYIHLSAAAAAGRINPPPPPPPPAPPSLHVDRRLPRQCYVIRRAQ